MIEFVAYGVPAPAGSKRGLPRKGGGVVVVEASERTRPWQATIAEAALEALDGRDPLEGPLFLKAVFVFTRPKAHEGLKGPTALGRRNPFPAQRPDVTKLLRALEDALNGLAWRDDSQIVTQLGLKRWGTRAGVHVQIERPTQGATVLLEPSEHARGPR